MISRGKLEQMRNLFLALVLANLLFLAWHTWIDPSQPAPPATGSGDLAVFGAGADSESAPAGSPLDPAAGACLRMGPLPGSAASQQARELLAARGIEAAPVAVDTQQWLGHWVQIDGFASVADAAAAHQRLIDAGLADAYLMQDGLEPLISLGVFRERERADRLAETARSLGFDVRINDRYRPAVEQWLLIRARPGQTLGAADLSIPGDRILRTENVPCSEDYATAAD